MKGLDIATFYVLIYLDDKSFVKSANVSRVQRNPWQNCEQRPLRRHHTQLCTVYSITFRVPPFRASPVQGSCHVQCTDSCGSALFPAVRRHTQLQGKFVFRYQVLRFVTFMFSSPDPHREMRTAQGQDIIMQFHQIHLRRARTKHSAGGIFGQRTVPVKQQLLESLPKISIQLLGLMDLF